MTRPYAGSLKAVIFDWAGTTVDYGCFAPVYVFIEIFEQRGVSVSFAQARTPMGLEKRDHIRAISQIPDVAEQWQHLHGQLCTEADIDLLYQASLSLQKTSVAKYANVIPGTLDAVAHCRSLGLKIGSTTGYSTGIMDVLRPIAAELGYIPDALACPDNVSAGRPAPFMIYKNAIELNIYPMSAVVKVGDTIPDIEEGRNAGAWTIAVTQTGNELGLSESEATALPEAELAARLNLIEERMREAGAHEVIRSIANLPTALDAIQARLSVGEHP